MRNPRLDGVADFFHRRRDRLCREPGGGDNMSRRNSERVCGGQHFVELCRVPRRRGGRVVLERLRLLDVFTSGVEDVPGDDDAVSAVLIEQSIDLEVERMSRDVPDDLVDTDALAARGITRKGAPETHHENESFVTVQIDSPLNGTETRVWSPHPSSVLTTSRSSQSEGCCVQSG